MKCAECRKEMLGDNNIVFIQGSRYSRKLFFCCRNCKREYLKHVLGDRDVKELNFNHRS